MMYMSYFKNLNKPTLRNIGVIYIQIAFKVKICLSDVFRVTSICNGDCSPHSGGLTEEEFRTKEEEQGTWESKATITVLLRVGF